MMQFTSIRVRLTLWYLLSLAAILAIVAVGSWFAVRASLNHAVDEVLRQRIPGVEQFLELHAGMSPQELNEEFNESANLSVGGGLFRIYDGDGKLLYASRRLAAMAPEARPTVAGTGIQFIDEGGAQLPVRLAVQQVHAGGQTVTVEVAEPLGAYGRALDHFAQLLWRGIPILIVLATAGGYWMSKRALAPVDRITQGARAITANNLSARLAVPAAKDELRWLSQTLNAMLGRLEISFNRVRQFTADASHELRAPLTLIHTAAEFSIRRQRSREELVEAMRKILRESQRMTRLVDNLLFLARADGNTAEFERHPVDLAAVIGGLQDEAVTLADARQISVAFDLPPSQITVDGEESSIRRLCLILIDNAIKYTPPGGAVHVALSEENVQASILVRDTGIGIAKDDLPFIFDRFWRADKVRSRDAGGTGLGLSIARRIVEQHGGALEVESTLGAGSTFSVRLPARAGQLANGVGNVA